MRKFRLNQRRVAIICAVILVGLSTVTVLRQKGVLFDAKQNDSANTHVEPAKKTNTAAPQPKQKVEPATDKTQNSPVPQAKPEASAMPASEKKTDEPQLKLQAQPHQQLNRSKRRKQTVKNRQKKRQKRQPIRAQLKNQVTHSRIQQVQAVRTRYLHARLSRPLLPTSNFRLAPHKHCRLR